MKESKVMQELHRIRERIYEEEKDLSIEERVRKVREESEKYIQEHNLKLRRVNSKNVQDSVKKSA
jgi:hypothetical protein